jgi:hypothetical protein
MSDTLSAQPVALLDLEDDVELQARLVGRALKTPFQGRVTYRQGDYIEGSAVARNLGHGDVALKLSRYIGPGEPVELELGCLTYRGLPVAMRGHAESCDQEKDGKSFVAIVHISRSGSRTR